MKNRAGSSVRDIFKVKLGKLNRKRLGIQKMLKDKKENRVNTKILTSCIDRGEEGSSVKDIEIQT